MPYNISRRRDMLSRFRLDPRLAWTPQRGGAFSSCGSFETLLAPSKVPGGSFEVLEVPSKVPGGSVEGTVGVLEGAERCRENGGRALRLRCGPFRTDLVRASS